MAVEADKPPNSVLGLFNNRPPPFAKMDSPASATEPRIATDAGAPVASLFPLYQSLEAFGTFSDRAAAAACTPAPTAVFPAFQQQAAMAPIFQRAAGTAKTEKPQRNRKRKMLDNEMRTTSPTLQNPANKTVLNLADFNYAQARSASPPASQNNKVSTGLCLASFDEDGSTVTSSRPNTGSACVNDELAAQFLHNQNELQQLLKAHVEQLKNALKDRTQMHSQVLLTTVEDEMSKRLREKDAELGRVKRHCNELEDMIKHLTLETQVWQSKARSYEGMVTVLRANLQQAIVHQSREQVKLEGCGDSNPDDAASAYIDENTDAQQNRAMMSIERKVALSRTCKRCWAKEVTILLLPCMHLCLCNECKLDVERCPVCATPRNAFIEVYLS